MECGEKFECSMSDDKAAKRPKLLVDDEVGPTCGSYPGGAVPRCAFRKKVGVLSLMRKVAMRARVASLLAKCSNDPDKKRFGNSLVTSVPVAIMGVYHW